MRLAQIEGGIVVNVIEVDEDAVPDWAEGWPEAVECGPGWSFSDGLFVPPPTPPEPVPEVVGAWQAKTQLLRAGLLAGAEDAVAASGDTELQIAWTSAPNFRRDSLNIAAIADALELTGAQVDDLFRAAALISG